MDTISLTKLTKNTGEVFDAAQRAPVILTRHNRKALVLMSYDKYVRLLRQEGATLAQGRGVTAYLTNDLPPDLAADLDAALEVGTDAPKKK